MNKMLKIAILIILLAVLTGGSCWGYSYWQWSKEDKFLSSDPNTRDAYALIKKRQEELKKNKKNYDALMSLGFNWKSIGEATKDNKYYLRAIDAYGSVVKLWGNRAYLPFLNRANVYILMGNYKGAEDDLRIATEIDPGEQTLYIALADLYKSMKKDQAEIRAVYERGIKTVTAGGNLVVSYASYLYEIGDYKASLKYYKALAQAFPANTAYSEMVADIESKLK